MVKTAGCWLLAAGETERLFVTAQVSANRARDGDRLSAAREMVEGGPIDALTGDWLAELTMLILARTQAKRPGGGYARTFVKQMEQVMGTCLDRGIKVVSNAGGLTAGRMSTYHVIEQRAGSGLPPLAQPDPRQHGSETGPPNSAAGNR